VTLSLAKAEPMQQSHRLSAISGRIMASSLVRASAQLSIG
jgi:hypothetical protein